MMKQFLMVRHDDGFIQGIVLQDDPDAGPIIPSDTPQPGFDMIHFDGEFSREGRGTRSAYWRNGAVEWIETATLEELKVRKNAEIDLARESANRSYFDFAGRRIGCEDMSWKDILSTNAEIALTQQMPEEWVGGWKTMDKTPDGGPIYVAIPDVPTWVLFIKAMVARGTAHFLRSQGLKNQLAAATSPEQITEITWAAGPTQPQVEV